jgi:hypothetical protein
MIEWRVVTEKSDGQFAALNAQQFAASPTVFATLYGRVTRPPTIFGHLAGRV